ncbi:glucose-1-phosphate thymidylyltransferase [Devosia sp. Root685]|uniref:glucose-1-phosphate thymidylyltransferase RfbA n=1 Tax=Devosia sp. Root685 TaxID=1736587 RepID=UPI0006FF09C7|nr:glucose-1-phosphate thymidylyltransferase RfbA [Devosia sp. Root685]KRA98391.1 glucose-1-phosphate thymidylyltransferase [Devosia sp. Root685]
MKAILLAGGSGSRLFPLTQVASKQLQPVYDKPMIYYPITVLIAAGIREILIISTPHDLPRFQQLLRDGSQWGVSFSFLEQARPNGIAEALLIGREFIGDSNFVLMLGDNIFSGGDDFSRAVGAFEKGASIFAYHVKDPSRYGVVEFDKSGNALSIEEKPARPKSPYAVPGVYIYDSGAVDIAGSIRPSARGELEITEVNLEYMRRGELQVRRLSRGFAWLDAGTSSALHEASVYVENIETRQGIKIGCPEEAAFIRGFLSAERFQALLETMPACEYRDYLAGVARELSGTDQPG